MMAAAESFKKQVVDNVPKRIKELSFGIPYVQAYDLAFISFFISFCISFFTFDDEVESAKFTADRVRTYSTNPF